MKRKSRLQTNQDLQGLLFLIPLLIGPPLFFVIPIVKSFLFSISAVGSAPKAIPCRRMASGIITQLCSRNRIICRSLPSLSAIWRFPYR